MEYGEFRINIFLITLIMTLFLTSATFTSNNNIERNTVNMWTGTIFVRADGSVYPPDAPIETHDNVTYVICGNVTSPSDGIVIEKDNVVIDGRGFTFIYGQGTPSSKGVYLSGRINVTIRGVTISGFCCGIYINRSSNCVIIRCNVTANEGYGIKLDHSLNNIISKNSVASNSWDGVMLYFSSNNVVSENFLLSNVHGLILISSVNNTLSKNGIMLNSAGIGLSFSSSNCLSQNNITLNTNGVTLIYSSNNEIIKNYIANNTENGIKLDSSNNTFVECNVVANNKYGVSIFLSHQNKIIKNNLINNEFGFSCLRSFSNFIYHNSFVDNTNQTYNRESINVWDNNYPLGGNYWSDYKIRYPHAKELNGSGLWDTPYKIDENNIDFYPLMYPYGTPTYKLTVIARFGGTTDPAPGTYTYAHETIVEVIAIPREGFIFDHWLFDGEQRKQNPVIVLMDKNYTLEANFVDIKPPVIGKPFQIPSPYEVEPDIEVLVRVNVMDGESGVNTTILSYTINNGLAWNNVTMEYVYCTQCNSSFYAASIPGMSANTFVQYKIIAYDNAGNCAVDDNYGIYYAYTVIPEFPSLFIVLLLLVLFFVFLTVNRIA